MNIPSIIKQQLLTKRMLIVGSWGAHGWIALSDNTLAFKVQARRLHGIITITLDEGADLYNIAFFKNLQLKNLLKNPRPAFESIEGVYCDQMTDMIDDLIEK